MRSRIIGIGTAVPAYEYDAATSAELALSLLPPASRVGPMLRRVYRNSGIERRRSVLPDFGAEPHRRLLFPESSDFRPEPSTARRNAVYTVEAPALAKSAVASLLEKGDLGLEGVSHLVTASCTGFSAPGWDYELLRDLPLPATTARYNIGFMGCFAAFPALRLADHIVRSEPGARVLVVALELCSLHYAIDASPDALVANALFADGAAAALVTGDGSMSTRGRPSFAIGPFASRVLPGTADEMAWTIGETGFGMKLSSGVAKSLGKVASDLVGGFGDPAGVRHWAVHPGGRAILDAFESALALPGEALAHSRAVLREHGNMSSPTVLFVLERLLAEARAGKVFASAFGPGLTAETCLLELET